MNLQEKYQKFCTDKGIIFQLDTNVKSYDETTLFCPAGMQQFKTKFSDESYSGTISNIQSCLRLNDLDEIGDGSHLLYFNMIGFFSFRDWSVSKTIDYWMDFLGTIDIRPDYVTIHPDKLEWKEYYEKYNLEIRLDSECQWSDGEIGGYCTEFYKDGIEIGNIVNPMGTCIDVGFGLERLEMVLTGQGRSKEDTLKETIFKLIESGFRPSNNRQGYILKKLLRTSHQNGVQIEHPFFKDEIERQENLTKKYLRLKDKYQHMPKEWWWDTHGIDLELI